jgi:hypothetical protein
MPAADIIMSWPPSVGTVSQSGLVPRARTQGCALHNFHPTGSPGTVFAVLISDKTPDVVRVRRDHPNT